MEFVQVFILFDFMLIVIVIKFTAPRIEDTPALPTNDCVISIFVHVQRDM